MKKGLLKKVKLVGIMLFVCSVLTACDIENVVSGYRESVNKRVEYNLTLLKDLQKVGLITQAMYENCEANIKENTKCLVDLSNTDLTAKEGAIKGATSYRASTESKDAFTSIELILTRRCKGSPAGAGHTKIGGNGRDRNDCELRKRYPTLHNWGQTKDDDLDKYLGAPNGEGKCDNPKALDIFSAKDENSNGGGASINTILNADIYVLDATSLVGQDLSDIAISCKTIKDLKDKQNLTSDEQQALDDARHNMVVFKPSGVTLLDGLTDKDGNKVESLTHETAFNQKAFDTAVNGGYSGMSESEANGSNAYEIGYDLAIFSDHVPVAALKLCEIDPKAVQALIDKCKSSEDAYLIDYHTGNQNESIRIYKMIYPVQYMDSVKWDGSSASFTTKESDLINVNIMTGEVALETESTLLSLEEKQNLEKIYNVTGNSDNKSSFLIWDEIDTTEKFADGTEKTYKENSILLQDYLEYTYLPDFIPGEPFVALGRRIRLYNIDSGGKFKDPNEIAKFIDKTGRPIDGVKAISTDDLLDFKSGNSDNDRKAIKSSKSMASGGNLGGGSGGSGGNSGGGSGGNSGGGTGSGGNSGGTGGNPGGSSGGTGGNSGGGSGGTQVAGTSGNSDPNAMGDEDPNSAHYLAGSWEQDQNDSDIWKFKQLDGTYICNTWAWIDSNSDGTAECYYFNEEGIMEWSCDIDGHEVGDSGALLDENGEVVTKAVNGRTPDNEGTEQTVASISLHDVFMVTSTFNNSHILNTNNTPNQGNSTAEPTANYVSGTWEQDTSNNTWKFKQGDGEYAKDKWLWIDGNSDGIAECYRFDGEILFVNGTVDGFNVNEDGAWYTGSGDIQTKDVSGMTPSNGSNLGNNGGIVVPNTGQGDTGFASDLANHRFDEYEYVDELHPVALFPVNDDANDFRVASSDAMFNGQSRSRTIMYGICTDVSMFDSQLYSAWVNVEGDGGTAGSLNWWNSWLEKAKFDYRIDKEALMEYLGLNFTADMLGPDSTAIILDVDTIEKIQRDMNEDDKVYRVTWIRTMFVILGYFTMLYAFLFLAAWAIDVSTIGDTKFMYIMSFGKCIAIRDDIEKPYYDDSGTSYLTFGNTLIRCIVMLALALILTRMDFITILVKSFGKISGVSQELFKRIFNI